MKALTIVVVAFLIEASGYLIKVPTGPAASNAPPRWMHLQKLVLPLFENVCEDSSDPVIIRSAQEFTSGLTTENYWKPDALPNFQKLKSGKGFLPKGEIFTEYNIDHLNELEIIYDILYYAKNFDIFFQGAAWARQTLNCGLYLDAIYLAITNRKDTERLVVPAPYELLPNYFIRKDVILEGTELAAGVNIELSEGVHVEGNAYQLDANYTSIFYDNYDESKLAYFREDIGLNSYYFIRKLKQAPWFNTGIDGRYGENVYQMMKQFMARYNLERYANGLPELESWTWNDPALLDVPYDPMLIYTNGNEFISRPSPVQLPDNEDVALLQTIENNIGTVVSHMRGGGYNKTQILNHLMEILVTGDRSYETLARQLLGKAHSDNGCPSVLEHYMTSLRDPIFWKINKKIVDLVDESLQLLPTYARNELYFPGLEIISIDVKKVMTFYDYFEFDVTDALKTVADKSTYQIKIAQPRLNHRPFSIKMNISSLVAQRGVVKVYLGPKILPGELAKKKKSFVLLDKFEYRFKIGSNIISRTSDDMKHFSEDFMSLRSLHKKVEDAEFGLESLPLKTIESQIGYPARLILPKGTMKGVPLQIFVFVAPYAKYSAGVMHSLKSMEFNKVIMSPGYPLDLKIEDKQLFELPNAMVKDIIVTHKGEGKVENYGGPGVTKKWYGTDTSDPSSKPNYAENRKKPFDYSAKKGQYGKQEESIEENEYESKEQEGFIDSFEDNYFINDGENSGFQLGSKSFDYTAKRKQPFDYKAKKNQYEKKDKNIYQNKNIYQKQFPQKEPAVSVKAEVPMGNIDMKSSKSILQKDIVSEEVFKNIDKDEVNIESGSIFRLDSSDYDYAAKRKPQFDYKAKNKQYGENVGFNQNKNVYKKEYPQKESALSASADVSIENFDAKLSKGILQKDVVSEEIFNNNNYKGHINIDNGSMFKLGSTGYDYAAKRKAPFDYKAKKDQYKNKDSFDQNINVYHTELPEEESFSTVSSKLAGVIVKNLETEVSKEKQKEAVSEEYVNSNEEDEVNIEQGSIAKLGSTSFDYAAKRKPPFDYKAKKTQYGKKGNFTRNKIIQRKDFARKDIVSTTEAQSSVENFDSKTGKVILEKDVLSEEIIKNNANKDTEVSSEAKADEQNYDYYKTEPDLTPVTPKKRYTIYDYIVHAFDDVDSLEEKVYE